MGRPLMTFTVDIHGFVDPFAIKRPHIRKKSIQISDFHEMYRSPEAEPLSFPLPPLQDKMSSLHTKYHVMSSVKQVV